MASVWTGEARVRGGAGKRALAVVVDGDARVRAHVAQALQREGLDALESASLEPALALLAARPAALVVLDAAVAAEACHAIRRLAGGADTPVIALVEPEDADAARQACEAGAADFVPRPIDAALLCERVRLVLARARERRARREARDRLESAQRLSRSGSFSVALAGGEVDASAPLFELLGLPPRASAPWRSFAEHVAGEDEEPLRRAVQRCLEADRAASLDVRILRADGVPRTLRCRLVARRDEDGEPVALEGAVQDVTDLRSGEPELFRGRRVLGERVEALVRDGRRFAVLALDLDHFERVSNTLGPRAGEALLHEAAARVLDAAGAPCGADDLAKRGGGELALLVPHDGEPRALADLARRCLDALARPYLLHAHEVTLGAFAGIALAPEDGADAEALVRAAATALHHAKEQGRGAVQFYRASMNASALSRLLLEAKLRRALAQGEFVLHYQPQIALATGEVVGFEGVVRWQEPELGLVGPAEFIPLAEETGLILALGDWIVREACHQVVTWRARGVCLVPISVNLSTQQLREPALVDRIAAALRETGAPPSGLVVEVTENVLLHDAARATETLSRLRALGVRVALDDFGTGFSSLSYLRHLPVDTLKIDRAFVTDVGADEAAAALTASIVAMGVALGLRVVAEGVEEEQQRELLRAFGCHEAQGFLFGRPAPADDAERTWAARVRGEL